MSFEGYFQRLCKNGHNCNCDGYCASDDDRCDFCDAEIAWENLIDQTNDDGQKDVVELEVDVPAEICECSCGHRHQIKPARHKIPEKGEVRR